MSGQLRSVEELKAEIERRRQENRTIEERVQSFVTGRGEQMTIGHMEMLRRQVHLNERTINALCWALGEDLLWE
jgi:alpha-D-ribose 1-methylphosphonate 5-triphosphate synthase subunit PhnG